MLQLHHAGRLDEESLNRHGIGIAHRLLVHARRKEQVWNTFELRILTNPVAHLKTVHARHVDVGKNQERLFSCGIKVSDRLFPVRKEDHLVREIQVSEDLVHDLLVFKIVLYHYDWP